jgi:hypothetical protein
VLIEDNERFQMNPFEVSHCNTERMTTEESEDFMRSASQSLAGQPRKATKKLQRLEKGRYFV